MGIATILFFIVPQSLQMCYPNVGPLSLEVQHIIFNRQLRVPHQTGSFLIISGTCCVSANTQKAVWSEGRNLLMMHFRRFRSFSSAPKCEGIDLAHSSIPSSRKTESPSAGEVTECCNTGFSGWFRVALSKIFGCDDFRICGDRSFKD